jgi:hypothetical protein
MEFCARLAQGICRVTDVQQFDAGSGTARGQMVWVDNCIVSAADLVYGGVPKVLGGHERLRLAGAAEAEASWKSALRLNGGGSLGVNVSQPWEGHLNRLTGKR